MAAHHIIGYYKLNVDTDGAEIQHIYLLKTYQQKQIGKHLLQHAITMAKSYQLKYLSLAVWDKNHRVINFYKTNGLLQFNTHHFDVAGQLQTDLLMRIDF